MTVCSVQKYEAIIFQLDSYLPYCLWDAEWSVGKQPRRYEKFKKRELLDVKDKLKQIGLDAISNEFSSTLTKLSTLEQKIDSEYKMYANVHKVMKATGTEPVSPNGNKGKKRNVQFYQIPKAVASKAAAIKAAAIKAARNHWNTAIAEKNYFGRCCQPKNTKQGGGAKYKGFIASKKTYKSIKMAFLADEKDKKRKADDDSDGNDWWMKDTIPSQPAYMI